MPIGTWGLAVYQFNFDWLAEAVPLLLDGLWVTITVTVVVMLLSVPLGLGVAFARIGPSAPLRAIVAGYTDFFRTTPLLIQIFLGVYALPIILGLNIDFFVAAVIALTLNVGAFLAEIFRGAIQSIDRGQREAAVSTGMTERQAMRRVVLPQAVRRSVPLMAALWLSLFKDTSLLSIVGIKELTGEGASIYRDNFRQIEVMGVLALIYFALTYPQSLIINRLFEKFRVRE